MLFIVLQNWAVAFAASSGSITNDSIYGFVESGRQPSDNDVNLAQIIVEVRGSIIAAWRFLDHSAPFWFVCLRFCLRFACGTVAFWLLDTLLVPSHTWTLLAARCLLDARYSTSHSRISYYSVSSWLPGTLPGARHPPGEHRASSSCRMASGQKGTDQMAISTPQ